MYKLLEETVKMVRLASHERAQQRTAEQIEDGPQFAEETVEAVTLVPCERVQQRTAERFVDVPHFPAAARARVNAPS